MSNKITKTFSSGEHITAYQHYSYMDYQTGIWSEPTVTEITGNTIDLWDDPYALFARKTATMTVDSHTATPTGGYRLCSATLAFSTSTIDNMQVDPTLLVTATYNGTSISFTWDEMGNCTLDITAFCQNGVVPTMTLAVTSTTGAPAYFDLAMPTLTAVYEQIMGQLVGGILVNPSEKTITVGESFTPMATVSPINAWNKTISWDTDKPSIVHVVPETGQTAGLSAGSATVFARAQDGSGVYGSCSVTVLNLVESITLSETKKELAPGETLTLTATVSPANAYVENVVWQSSNSGVASVNANGVVTAHSDGIALITATAGGKTSAACRIRIDSRARVEILPDPLDSDYNMVQFKNGKVWHCVDHDLLFRDDYSTEEKEALVERAMLNCAVRTPQGLVYGNGEKTYSEQEMRLLYAIDPLGVAYYVDWYSKNSRTINDPEMSIWGYKNQIFRLLFGREPIYLAENINGEWDRTYATPNTNTMLSESELYFGIHFILDPSIIQGFIVDSIVFAIGALANKLSIKPISDLLKIVLRIFAIGEAAAQDDLFNGITSEAFDEYCEKTQLEWVDNIKKVYAIYGTIFGLAQALKMEVNFYGDYIHYTANDVNFRVFVKIGNDFIEMADIDEALAALEN
ncbi:MAG: Ig domain-containing protein [Clostridia bacterium]|nr:Ig domain-containing protein [Clostridia bacterium]